MNLAPSSLGSHGRDGLDLVNCRNVLIEQSRIEGSDDALCFKTIGNDGVYACVHLTL